MELSVGAHTRERARERGATVDELRDVLATGNPVPAKHGRLAREKVYEFGTERLGKLYAQKKVRLVYVVEDSTAVAITAYVYYGAWEE